MKSTIFTVTMTACMGLAVSCTQPQNAQQEQDVRLTSPFQNRPERGGGKSHIR